MIEELTSYFAESFYTQRDERILRAFDKYQEGLGLEGEEGIRLKESARRTLEEELVASGQSEEDRVFINPEEFFPGGVRNDEKIDDFRRDMIRSHGGQQMLWSFAGTTGAMTVITEKHLESLGRDLDSLKPTGMKRKDRSGGDFPSKGTVPLYLYGDGSASSVYQKEKAKLRFDRCRDRSGFDWNQKKYDPNYTVEKRDWFGALNRDGEWVALSSGGDGHTESAEDETALKREIELVPTLNGPLIFDAALILCGPEEEEYYYSLEGELYGAVKTDRQATVDRLKESLAGQSPVGIVLPSGTDEETRKAYETLLEDLVPEQAANSPIPVLYEETEETWKTLLTEDAKERERLTEATLAAGAAARLCKSGVEEETIGRFLETEEAQIEIPLNPFVKEDRTVLLEESLTSLEPEEALSVRDSVEIWFETRGNRISSYDRVPVIPSLTAALPLLAAALRNGVGAEAVLEEAVKPGKEKSPAAGVKLSGRVKLEELTRGVTPWQGAVLSGGAAAQKSAVPDFFSPESRQKAVQTSGLKEGEIASLADSVEKLNMPPMDRKDFNRRMAAALPHYRTIQSSTGMTVSDLVSTVDSLTMNRPDAKRLGGKEIFFEESLGSLLSGGSGSAVPTKRVGREEIYQPLLKNLPESIPGERRTELFQQGAGAVSKGSVSSLPVMDRVTALPLTDKLLSALAAAPSAEGQPLSSKQLSGLKSLYRSSGTSEEVTREAVERWEQVKFTPKEYKATRDSLKRQLNSAAQATQAAKGGSTPSVENTVMGATRMFTGEEQQAVQAVMEAYREDEAQAGTGMNHAMSEEALMPLVSRALAGQWSGVPDRVRPRLSRALGKTAGGRMPSSYRGNTPSQVLLKEARETIAQERLIPHSTLTPVTRQMPLNQPTAISGKSGYNRVGYRVNPGRNSIVPVHKQAGNSLLEGVLPLITGNGQSEECLSSAPPRARVVSGSRATARSAGIASYGQAVTVKAQVNQTSSANGNIRSFPHPVMSGSGGEMRGMGQGFSESTMFQGMMNPAGRDGMNSFTGKPGGMNQKQVNNTPVMGNSPQSRLDRINANYERDKASLGQGEQRMLARSDSHSVGHAVGNGEDIPFEKKDRSISEVADYVKNQIVSDV